MVVDTTAAVPKPTSMGFEEAAGLMLTGATAVHTLMATSVGPGDTVLVHGAAGGVGQMAVQIAIARGARVIGTAARLELVDLVAAGKLSVSVAATYPLSDVVESQEAILTGHTSGKIVLVP